MEYNNCVIGCQPNDSSCFSGCSRDYNKNFSYCPCEELCQNGCPCDYFTCLSESTTSGHPELTTGNSYRTTRPATEGPSSGPTQTTGDHRTTPISERTTGRHEPTTGTVPEYRTTQELPELTTRDHRTTNYPLTTASPISESVLVLQSDPYSRKRFYDVIKSICLNLRNLNMSLNYTLDNL